MNMTLSYSFHLSAKSHALTNKTKIGQVSRHNLRAYKSANYDKNLIDVMVGSNTSLLDDVKKIYNEEFSEALAVYNQKQKKKDRKIDDYLQYVSKSRNDVAAEVIIQIGDKDFWKEKNLSEKKVMEKIFQDQIDALAEYCPNFKIASAVAHYDEASPHLHIVGVPVAKGYKIGMKVQCAKTKIFTKESLSKLQDNMRESAEISMKKFPELFTNISIKEKENGRNKDIPKQSLDEYHELKRKLKNMDVMTAMITAEPNVNIQNCSASGKRGVFVENMNKEQISTLIARVRADDGLERALDKAQTRSKNIIEQATAKHNETIRKAEQIIQQRDTIIAEINRLENQKKQLERKIKELHEAKGIVLENFENELDKTKFRDWSDMPRTADYDAYRRNGELMALYNDGTIFEVGSNENGGWDEQTYNDFQRGLCRVGIIQKEEIVKLPKSLFRELVNARAKDKKISKELEKIIEQHDKLERILSRK